MITIYYNNESSHNDGDDYQEWGSTQVNSVHHYYRSAEGKKAEGVTVAPKLEQSGSDRAKDERIEEQVSKQPDSGQRLEGSPVYGSYYSELQQSLNENQAIRLLNEHGTLGLSHEEGSAEISIEHTGAYLISYGVRTEHGAGSYVQLQVNGQFIMGTDASICSACEDVSNSFILTLVKGDKIRLAVADGDMDLTGMGLNVYMTVLKVA